MASVKPLFEQVRHKSSVISYVEILRERLIENPEQFLSHLQRMTWIGKILTALFVYFPPVILFLVPGNSVTKSLLALLSIFWVSRLLLAERLKRTQEWPALEIDSVHAPKLFDELNILAKKLNCPTLDRVRLGSEVQAYVRVKSPRLGAKKEHIIYLGLPLIRWITTEEFRFIAAHEIAHLSGGRAKIIRNSLAFEDNLCRLIEAFSIPVFNQTVVAGMRLFHSSFRPYLQAACLEEELRVDLLASKHADPMAGCINLLRLSAIDSAIRIWPKKYMRDRIANSEITTNAFNHFETFCSNGIDKALAEAVIEADLNLPTPEYSFHPAILERIQALRCEPPIRNRSEFASLIAYLTKLPDDHSGLELLGELLPVVTRSIHEIYEQSYGEKWRRTQEWLTNIAPAVSRAISLCNSDPTQVATYGSAIGFYYYQRGESRTSQEWYEAVMSQSPDDEVALVGLLTLKLDDLAGSNPTVLDEFERLGIVARSSLLESMREYVILHQSPELQARFDAISAKTLSSLDSLSKRASQKPVATDFKAKPIDELTKHMILEGSKVVRRQVNLYSVQITESELHNDAEHVLFLVGKPKIGFEIAEKFNSEMRNELNNFIVPGSMLMYSYTYQYLRYLPLLAKIIGAELAA